MSIYIAFFFLVISGWFIVNIYQDSREKSFVIATAIAAFIFGAAFSFLYAEFFGAYYT